MEGLPSGRAFSFPCVLFSNYTVSVVALQSHAKGTQLAPPPFRPEVPPPACVGLSQGVSGLSCFNHMQIPLAFPSLGPTKLLRAGSQVDAAHTHPLLKLQLLCEVTLVNPACRGRNCGSQRQATYLTSGNNFKEHGKICTQVLSTHQKILRLSTVCSNKAIFTPVCGNQYPSPCMVYQVWVLPKFHLLFHFCLALEIQVNPRAILPAQ